MDVDGVWFSKQHSIANVSPAAVRVHRNNIIETEHEVDESAFVVSFYMFQL